MDDRIKRFTYCDPEFHPYLERVFSRLPENIRESVLGDRGFQIIGHEDLLEACVARYGFEPPLHRLVYLNIRLLREPEHRILYTVAREIALYTLGSLGPDVSEEKIDGQLLEWDFANEVDAFRHELAVAQSEEFKVGYQWAIRQDPNYLLMHFSVYFDEWNKKGLRKMPEERLRKLREKAEVAGVPEEAPVALPLDEAMLSGVMTAVKEIKLRDLLETRKCDIRP